MATRFEQWVLDDDRWFTENRKLLEEVWHWFVGKGEWPDVEPLQHAIHKMGWRMKVSEVANARPGVPGLMTPAVQPRIVLGARHLLAIEDARPYLEFTVRAAQLAVKSYLDWDEGDPPPQISASDFPLWKASTELVVDRFPRLVDFDHPTPFDGTNFDEWSIVVNKSLVMEFENVRDPADYVARQKEIIKGWAAKELRPFVATMKTPPFTAFVVMPIGGDWSTTIHAFIKRAAQTFGGEVETIRADEISRTGRISDQIIEGLQESDFVIADVTQANPNVSWELGYAYAFGKPCVMLRSDDAKDPVPFDIYDHRRVEYSPVPTPEDERRLRAMIESAVDEVRSANKPNLGDIFHDA
jgi:hypothetical protein